MSNKQFQEPIVTHDSNGVATESHPAYGQIEVVRTHGGNGVMYGSSSAHPTYITLRIASSESKRDLSTDWHHANSRPMVEVGLTEAQFASLMANVGMGGGVCCTLMRVNGETVPGITPIESKVSTFKGEMLKSIKKTDAQHAQLMEMLQNDKIPAKLRAQLIGMASGLRDRDLAAADFIADQFNEYCEKTVASAKQDFEAYTQARALRLGLQQEPEHAQHLLR